MDISEELKKCKNGHEVMALWQKNRSLIQAEKYVADHMQKLKEQRQKFDKQTPPEDASKH